MSTRSFICIEDAEHGYRGIYCHYDGYPEHVGKLLVEFHNSLDAAESIVHGPQIRNLDNDGMVVRYGDGTPDDSEVYLGIEDALNSGFDYVYLYDDDCWPAGWRCFKRDSIYKSVLNEIRIPAREVV